MRSDEVPLGGTSLKNLKFETIDKRNEGKVNHQINETKLKKLKIKEEVLLREDPEQFRLGRFLPCFR
jgi:hypothetical protein